ncbi:hypothetical protein MSG_04122 [Mycobacterium shigaense]|uniref:Antitoxin n=1 Tax=Mycobacterium shigaense TaxID=722731 RepID=A0A1Z4EML2_9MYCO|nr:hypothetical protein MSG_04122 [Mycobacterium shigaense]
MTERKRLTDAEYAALADDYERNPITPNEVLGVWINPSALARPQSSGGED